MALPLELPPDTGPQKPKPALSDRYALREGRILVSGAQALIRLMIEQHARDRAAGLNTAGYVSGYRGSPLADFDSELARARQFLDGAEIRFQPGLNEDLAATAVWGSQQIDLSPGAKHDGVFAMWYGKGPGVDRSVDAIRHANAAGTHPNGGVLLLMGDDHGAVSSTLPHQSEYTLISAMVPILSPAGVEDYIPFGLAGFAMSRFSGAWVGFKCQTEIVECSSTVDLPGPAPAVLPDFEMPPGGLSIRWPDDKIAQDPRLEVKLRAAQAFARANRLDVISGAKAARRGIIATGKAWRDLRGALEMLGLSPEAAGLRLLKVGLIWPMEPRTLAEFADGLEEILVIEEKRPVMEEQIRALFYNNPIKSRPVLWGKTAPDGTPLISAWAELEPVGLAADIARFLRMNAPAGSIDSPAPAPLLPVREPYFCSGCPHSVSTRVPTGSRATAGIGCSMLAVGMDRNVETFTQMGGEGANWIGHAPFTDEKHVFVHMGDGTYFHSGLLAIRAAIAAQVNATYKILFNDAVAMTGGQRHDGALSVPAVVEQILAEGVRELVVIAEDPSVWKGRLPAGVLIRPRDFLQPEQERLREIEGVTCIVYDQVCAAEKRRRRKRGSFPKPAAHVMINPEVCEGCGDCSVQSNCISVEPLETDLGAKRRINLSACNVDMSCLKGFCPSFVTISGATRRQKLAPLPEAVAAADAIPVPEFAPAQHHALMLAGIGGTGVITVSAILAQAAYLDGLAVQVLNQTGLAQKNGAVISHLRMAADPVLLNAPRIGANGTDTLLAFDSVVAASPRALRSVDPARSKIVADRHVTPTAGFVRNPLGDLRSSLPMAQLKRRAGNNLSVIDATDLALRYFGDVITANILLTGHAFQLGHIPIGLEAITTAITLNGGAVGQNLRAFAAGRLLAHDPSAFEAIPRKAAPTGAALKAMLIRRLTDYSNANYAARFTALVDQAEGRVAGWEGAGAFLDALMRGAYHVMAIKDEYEVARLHSDPAFLQSIAGEFSGKPVLNFHLAPPLFSRMDQRTGRPKKRSFGPWIRPVFAVLARLKGLRGRIYDPFGHSHERREERALREEYIAQMRALISTLRPAKLETATETARSVLQVRGYGPIRAKNLAAWREKNR